MSRARCTWPIESMAHRRRRRPHLNPDPSDSGKTSNMEQLAFKYKEMCKVESSTDSDSEISPRWSDTSTMECVSSAPESGSLRRTLPLVHDPAGRQGCYSLFLDPYDGSSEDSDDINMDPSAPSRRTRQHGARFQRRSRRFILHPPHSTAFRPMVEPTERVREQGRHLVDVHMKCVDDSEVWLCELTEDLTGSQAAAAGIQVHCRLHRDTRLPESSSERPANPCNVRVVLKRKLAVPVADGLEQKKKQRVVHMAEDEEGGGDSASEACESPVK
ncbi:uncharacterized protein LOC133488292 isoform X1 [Phyllopteryx taeniolatus]|uniref:uncharacterized protein LOC133488292 isoform X1 n=1 Tax=Phyllopteryx taeniolatus TaxID=161469 RepID=UPI002AD42AAE|nr:uncharacterized protein LOC133488292 isoform X1 [Phyllopteryx taeniolatus]XP_061651946.1 uncharacterized protein LOC133488292 isoform X1 [Phyllopteryx taeniolatus]